MDPLINKPDKLQDTVPIPSKSSEKPQVAVSKLNETSSPFFKKPSDKSNDKQVDRLVLQYLRAKGYTDAEKIFKKEAKVITSKSEDFKSEIAEKTGDDEFSNLASSDSDYYGEITDDEQPKFEVYVDLSKDPHKNVPASDSDPQHSSEDTISLESLKKATEKRSDSNLSDSEAKTIKKKKIKINELITKELLNISVEGNDVTHIVDLFKNKKSQRSKYYALGFSKLARWIDNSLEIYKVIF
ncbi:hypothetical protein AYI70_g3856 [Smittium culicis]|uniref:Uncharacterized protein n=1 Tax=Smittium culicis TaxID=133412 RepID=A0A1R1Y1Z5_9FUNG|nr:hypothetical protein AYI70_g8682 [Smittium culicis]OMJ20824.1 hypothetical protein AYI70_g3856 [Smittium culicis]